ncbi:HAD-IIB family hydrolase [Clostridium butyricum]
MKYDGFIIYSDFDGTLTDSEHKVHKENIEGISYFVKHGGVFSLATGRGIDTFILDKGTFNIPVNAPLILANGAEIYDVDKRDWIKQFTAPNSINTLIRKIYDMWTNAGLSIYTLSGEYRYRYNGIISKDIKKDEWLKNKSDIKMLETLSGTISMINVFGDDKVLAEIRKYIESYYCKDFVCTTSYPNFMNVTPKGVSKGDALSYLKEYIFDKGRSATIITIGDNENDKEMFEEGDFSFVMGNGNPYIHDYADILLKDNTFPSIPQVLNYIDGGMIIKKILTIQIK